MVKQIERSIPINAMSFLYAENLSIPPSSARKGSAAFISSPDRIARFERVNDLMITNTDL